MTAEDGPASTRDRYFGHSVEAAYVQLWNVPFQSLGESIAVANHEMKGSFVSEDFKEGVAHFVEKRKARFTGR